MKDVKPVPVTSTTSGLSKDIEIKFRAFIKGGKIKTQLKIHAEGNSSAEVTVAGLNLGKVNQFLDKEVWYYK